MHTMRPDFESKKQKEKVIGIKSVCTRDGETERKNVWEWTCWQPPEKLEEARNRFSP